MKKTLTVPGSFRFLAAWRVAVAALVAVVLTGCQGVNRLREAQDSFSAAARLENTQQLQSFLGSGANFGDPAGGAERALPDLNAARNGYAAAILSLDRIPKQDLARLKEDRLLGTALTLRALAYWRLGDIRAALDTAGEATEKHADQLYPRDAALLVGLRGLIKIDLAYAQVAGLATNAAGASGETVLNEVRARLVGPATGDETCAVEDLRQARTKVGPDHPLNVYLIQAQLSAYRNYQTAWKRVRGARLPSDDAARKEAGHQLHELIQLLDRLDAGPAGVTLVTGWRDNYNIQPQPRSQP